LPLPAADAPCAIGFAHGGAARHAHEHVLRRALLAAGLDLSAAPGTRLAIALHRRDPLRSGVGDGAVVAAQAAGRVVIAFAGDLDAPELIVPGVTGFVVETVDEAVTVVRELAAEVGRRQAMAIAARAAARAREDDQRRRTVDFYRGTMR